MVGTRSIGNCWCAPHIPIYLLDRLLREDVHVPDPGWGHVSPFCLLCACIFMLVYDLPLCQLPRYVPSWWCEINLLLLLLLLDLGEPFLCVIICMHYLFQHLVPMGTYNPRICSEVLFMNILRGNLTLNILYFATAITSKEVVGKYW